MSTINIIDVYTVHTITDDMGRNGDLVGIFTDLAKADIISHGRGWYGGKGNVTERKALYVGNYTGQAYLLDDEINDFVALNKDLPQMLENRRQEALSKLTKEDREALGL